MSPQKIVLGMLALLLIISALILAACAEKTKQQSPIERGRYLVTIGNCNDCHTPKIFTAHGPVLDSTRMLSGHPANAPLPEIPKGVIGPMQWGALASNDLTAWAGPWGVSYAYNLTPDMETGIGGWTEDLFIQTLRKGKFMGASRDILPPMPWEMIAQMSDDDLKAVFAYLKSLPPVENPIPPPMPPAMK